MQNTSGNSPRPPFLKRLFSWRTFGRCLIGVTFLATLIAILYVEENWRGKKAWENYKREAEARGVEFDWHKVVPPAVQDDQNFAMTPILAPLYDFNPLPLKPAQSAWRDQAGYQHVMNLATNLPDDPRSIAPEKLLSLLQPYQPVMLELIDASHRPHVRYNIDYAAEDPQSILLPHLMIVKKLQRLFEYSAVAELAVNRTEAAVADIDMSFYLAGTIKGEPFLISQLVRVAVLKMACVPIYDGLAQHRWSDNQLQHFETLLKGVNELEDFDAAIKGERAIFGIKSFDLMRSSPRSYHHFGEQPTVMPSGWAYLEQVSYHREIDEKILPSLDPRGCRVYSSKADEIPVAFPETFGGRVRLLLDHRILTDLMAGAIRNSLLKAAYGQTKLDELMTACALERYRLANNKLPDTLDELSPKFIDHVPHDICTGEPLKYHRVGADEFALYSVGWNLTDDGGKLTRASTGPHLIEGDWPWWQDGSN